MPRDFKQYVKDELTHNPPQSHEQGNAHRIVSDLFLELGEKLADVVPDSADATKMVNHLTISRAWAQKSVAQNFNKDDKMTVSMGKDMDAVAIMHNIIGTKVEGIGSTVIGYNHDSKEDRVIFKDNFGNTLKLGADVVMIDGVLHLHQIVDEKPIDTPDKYPEGIQRPLLIDRT